MSNVKILSDLDLHLLQTKKPPSDQVSLVESAFEFWKSSWEKTFQSLHVDVGHKLYSDDFLGRDVIALFDGSTPAALFFYHTVHLTNSELCHSYFKNYPSEVISGLQKKGFSSCMVLSYMTVQPYLRKSETDVPMFELLFSLGVKKFKSSDEECLFGYIRKDLSFHASFERHGGIKLGENHVYNVNVDYLYMTKDSMRLSPLPGVADTANILWERMLFRERGLNKIKKAA